jgi:rhamnulokinase
MAESAGAPNATPDDPRALIAVDLGAESCRVSLLRWIAREPVVTLIHRFPNAPRIIDGGLRWDLSRIEAGLDHGLRECAAIATEGIRSIAVDGWAVDYVRLYKHGKALADPFCYRDERTIAAEASLHRTLTRARLRELTGVQLFRINTLYQLHADALAHLQPAPWLNLPEYILHRWGAAPVAERTNATHSQLINLQTGEWCPELFTAAGADITCAPKLVPPGSILGKLSGPLAELPAFRDTALIAPACHDTASAIAGIPASGGDWAYISSGTWSLVGALLDQPANSTAAAAENFTNLGAVGGKTCFHKNVNGMWLLRQCMDEWEQKGSTWTVDELVKAAEALPDSHGVLDVDDPQLMLIGDMHARINFQLQELGLNPLDPAPQNAPVFARLIFHSLATRYAAVLGRVAAHTGKQLKRLYIVGGGSQNQFLNRLTAQATGLKVIPASAESSTLGNFAVQLAALEQSASSPNGVPADDVARWASRLPTKVS